MEEGTLSRLVRDALAHLHDRPHLAAHALATALGLQAEPQAAERLRGLLLEAIEDLRPVGTPGGYEVRLRQYRQMVARYLEGKSRYQAARAIGVSLRQASRDHEHAIEALASVLWLRRTDLLRSVSVGGLGGDVAEEASKLVATETTADVVATIQSALATLRNLAAARRVSVSCALDDPLPAVTIGRTLLRQAILSVLMFATSLASGEQLVITASDTARGVLVKVRCPQGLRGAEAAPSDLDSMNEASPLLGAARQMLKAQGGALEVTGPSDQVGITLVLPPVPSHTLLVVDDNPDLASLFQRYLRGEAYRVVQATSGERARQLAAQLRPDVIVLDVMLPSQDGWEILQRLRDDPETGRIPIVVCSVLPERELALSLGVGVFLAKPVTRSTLLAALGQCCLVPGAHPARL